MLPPNDGKKPLAEDPFAFGVGPGHREEKVAMTIPMQQSWFATRYFELIHTEEVPLECDEFCQVLAEIDGTMVLEMRHVYVRIAVVSAWGVISVLLLTLFIILATHKNDEEIGKNKWMADAFNLLFVIVVFAFGATVGTAAWGNGWRRSMTNLRMKLSTLNKNYEEKGVEFAIDEVNDPPFCRPTQYTLVIIVFGAGLNRPGNLITPQPRRPSVIPEKPPQGVPAVKAAEMVGVLKSNPITEPPKFAENYPCAIGSPPKFAEDFVPEAPPAFAEFRGGASGFGSEYDSDGDQASPPKAVATTDDETDMERSYLYN